MVSSKDVELANAARAKVISQYKNDNERQSDTSCCPLVARLYSNAAGKPRVGEIKDKLDQARYLFNSLRFDDFRFFTEEFWEDSLMLLSNLSPNIKFTNQYSVVDTTTNAGKSGVRFFDFIQVCPNFIRIFELKSTKITKEDVVSTIGKGTLSVKQEDGGYKTYYCKNYLEVISDNWPDTETRLIFTSPSGIEPEAIELINSRDNLYYVNFRSLAREIVNDLILSYPPEASWKYEGLVYDRFSYLV